jgi:hypothetical protein
VKKYLQILLISFATFFVVANNIVLQYNDHLSKMQCADQTDDEDAKSEKTSALDENEQTKAFCHLHSFSTFSSTQITTKTSYLNCHNNQLPSIALDVELLPPNFS